MWHLERVVKMEKITRVEFIKQLETRKNQLVASIMNRIENIDFICGKLQLKVAKAFEDLEHRTLKKKNSNGLVFSNGSALSWHGGESYHKYTNDNGVDFLIQAKTNFDTFDEVEKHHFVIYRLI